MPRFAFWIKAKNMLTRTQLEFLKTSRQWLFQTHCRKELKSFAIEVLGLSLKERNVPRGDHAEVKTRVLDQLNQSDVVSMKKLISFYLRLTADFWHVRAQNVELLGRCWLLKCESKGNNHV